MPISQRDRGFRSQWDRRGVLDAAVVPEFVQAARNANSLVGGTFPLEGAIEPSRDVSRTGSGHRKRGLHPCEDDALDGCKAAKRSHLATLWRTGQFTNADIHCSSRNAPFLGFGDLRCRDRDRDADLGSWHNLAPIRSSKKPHLTPPLRRAHARPLNAPGRRGRSHLPVPRRRGRRSASERFPSGAASPRQSPPRRD